MLDVLSSPAVSSKAFYFVVGVRLYLGGALSGVRLYLGGASHGARLYLGGARSSASFSVSSSSAFAFT